ncbi:MAG: ABC transporter permease [Anaerolineae bacterium]|nr:ABC transporter permease [Anaerolineae bacterium]
MTQYLIRRALQSILILFIISVILFGLVSSFPGGIMASYEENPDYTAEDYARLRAKYGLDQPVPVRYARWLGSMLQGDWGNSFVTRRPALQEIADRLPNTMLLMGVGFIVTLVIAIPIGIISALKQYSLLDNIITTLAFAGQSLPVFWFGLLLIIVFHVKLGWLPGAGMMTLGAEFSLIDRVKHLVLPVTMISLVTAAGYVRYTRSSMLEVINQDYLRTARAKGLYEQTVVLRHALRNALIPVVTLLALDVPYLFGGALFTETIFGWPGMARLFFDSALKPDIPVIMAVLMIFSALIVVSNLLVDVIYVLLDPRIRLS